MTDLGRCGMDRIGRWFMPSGSGRSYRRSAATRCSDPWERVHAPWCAEQRHRLEQGPRQLQLTLSIHRLAIVRHSDERQSRKAARQDSTSGTRRKWPPRTATNWARRRPPTGGPDRAFPVRLESRRVMRGIESASSRCGVGVKPPSPLPASPASSVRRATSHRQRTTSGIGPSASPCWRLPSPFDRSPLHSTDRSRPPEFRACAGRSPWRSMVVQRADALRQIRNLP
jgi:hypothetical protein